MAGVGPPPILVAIDEPAAGSPRATTSTSGTSADPAVAGLPEQLFFIHGWPDNHRMWDAQVEQLSLKYRCVTITLPHFGGRGQPAAAPAWGYDFDELAALCGRTMRASLTAAGRYQERW